MKMRIIKNKAIERKIVLRVLFRFLITNALLTILISYQYILHEAGVETFLSAAYLHVALISNFAGIYFVLAVLSALLLTIVPKRRILFFVGLPLILLIHILTLVDVTLFRIFKFHINSMVLNLFLTEGAWDSVHLGTVTVMTTLAIIGFSLFLEIALLRRLLAGQTDRARRAVSPRQRRQAYIKPLLTLLIILFFTDKLTYAVADLYNRQEITRHRAVFPLYYGFTMKRFMRKYFHFELDREDNFKVSSKKSPLNYPTAPLEHKPLETYPNIVWIIVDAWRSDMLREDISPNICRFSDKALVFKNHYSGGNASRFGIYSLLFGTYAYYWHQFLGARQSAVLIDELLDLNYDFEIVSSTQLTYPEFRKTAFIKIPYAIDDKRDKGLADVRDPQTMRHFLRWLDTRESSKPFFSFIYFDAPHGPYSYPDEYNKFTPSNKTANYLTVNKNDVVPLKNSYKNAIYFNDDLVGKIISSLEQHELLEDTIVLITADHGEEFYESGFFGHTSAFTKEQTKVPFILYLPGIEHQEIQRLTSHLDVVPTMLSLLGYTSPPEIYSHGFSLLEKEREHPFVVSCGWDDCAMIDGEHSIVFSTETYNALFFEVRDQKYSLIKNYRPILNEKYDEILSVFEGFRQFNQEK